MSPDGQAAASESGGQLELCAHRLAREYKYLVIYTSRRASNLLPGHNERCGQWTAPILFSVGSRGKIKTLFPGCTTHAILIAIRATWRQCFFVEAV